MLDFSRNIETKLLTWKYVSFILVLILVWLKIISGLMVTDVWDETNIILLSKSPPLSNLSIFESIVAIWTNYFGLYRPFASSLLALGLKLGANFEWLRYANAAMLVLAILIFALITKTHFNTPNKWVAIFLYCA